MEFWGVEVKAGQPVEVIPDDGKIIHISQASLGDVKKGKGNDLIPLHLKINGQKFVVGSLSGENFPQITFDFNFEKKFELSHDWENGSVYFCGYSAVFREDESDNDEDDDDDVPQFIIDDGKIEPKVEDAKPASSNGKAAKPDSSAKVEPKPESSVKVEPKKDDESEDKDESDEDEDESEEDEDGSDDEGLSIPSDDNDSSESEDDSEDGDDSEDEDEKTPKKADSGKKRPAESATKTPVAKKAKFDTPQKTDGKKGGVHTATPHPSKQAGKTAANGSKSKEKTPKSDANVSCKSCPKTFGSGKALESHTNAKHGK